MRGMDTKTPAQAAAEEKAIAILGGPANAARVLNVKDHRYQTVQSWLKNRIPAEYCPLIELRTTERGTPVRCEDLRPDVAWGVLREQAAPLIPAEQGA